MLVRAQARLAAGFAFFSVLFLAPNCPIRRVPSEDAGVFLYVARTIASGGMPYRDVWDHKPPGVYLLDVLAGGSVWGVFALQLVLLFAATWISYRSLVTSGFIPPAAAFGSIAWLVAVPRLVLEDGLQTNFAELYALPLQLAALGLFAADETRASPTWRTVAVGALGAGAVLLKPTLIGIWVAIAIVLLATRVRSGRWPDLARRAFLLIVPASLVVALVIGWLALGGALGDAIDQVVRYNAAYSGFATPLDRLIAIAMGLRLTLPSGLAVLAVAGWVATFRGPRAPLVLVAAVAFPIELLLASAGRGYHYYFLAWLPSMAVLAAHLWARLAARFGVRIARPSLLAVGAMTIVPTLLAGRLLLTFDDGAARGAAAYIDEATRPGDTVLVWGSRAEVFVLSDRRAPTRYVYQYAALATRGYATTARIDELIAQLARERPRLIVDTSKDSFVTPPLDRAGLASWTSPEPQYAWPPETSRIVDFVEANYERVATLPQTGWPVWRLRTP
ncbi:MAG TPA: hypothetical protein VGR87_10920 [Candidatus Limnocylindria bacterium]|jgi:hypothetical protein|nr:hypothetical protein [Candidatus Limnocylindria bacterium]